jgi:aminopeptidase N
VPRPPQRRSDDPCPRDAELFDGAVYDRGAAALHALRLEIGDADFFRLLRRWTALHAGGNVVIPQFTTLAERISGEELDALFDAWRFTPAKPAGLEAAQRRASAAETSQSSRRAAGSYATLSARASRRPSK